MLLTRGEGASFESEHSISIELHSPDVPDLTLIDLPGIVRTHVEGQSETVMEEVNGLLERYLQQERTIILAVIPSNVDIATVDILERASKADPQGVRTIGVLTKPDLIDKSAEDEVVRVLQGLRKPLRLGYYMVKNRSQKELDEELSLKDARAREEVYYRNHTQFGALNSTHFGVEQLTSALTKILVVRIKDQLPEMQRQLANLLTATMIERMGRVSPQTDAEMRDAANAVVLKIGTLLDSASSGSYVGDSIFARDPSMRLMALIRAGPHVEFAEDVAKTKPMWSVEELVPLIASMRGREVPGFPSFQVFELLMKSAVVAWEEPMQELLKGIFAIVEEVCETAVAHCTSSHEGLTSTITATVREIISARISLARGEVIPELVKREQTPFTLNSSFIEDSNRKREASFEQVLKRIPWYNASEAKEHVAEWYRVTNSIGGTEDDSVQHEARVMQMLLEAYWKTALERTIDTICMAIDDAVIKDLSV